MKPRILHVIDSLRRGGAEVLLVGVITALKDYNHSIVTLWPENEFEEINDVNYHYLDYRSKLHLPRVVRKLRGIINSDEPDLIHSHLLSATMIARLAKPRNVPLIFSVHNILSKSAFQHSKLSWLIEKVLYRKDHYPIFVSEGVKSDYDDSIGIKGPSKVIYNYVSDAFFSQTYYPTRSNQKAISLVTVGSLKDQKNHQFLIKCLSNISTDFSLDIYGDGPLRGELTSLIKTHRLEDRIHLRGNVQNIPQVLTKYDIFVFPSKYEGFGIAPVEAMAVGLPMILSDIPVFREVILDNAVYFTLDNADDFSQKLNHLMATFEAREELSRKGKTYAREVGEKHTYLKKLRNIYNQQIGNSK